MNVLKSVFRNFSIRRLIIMVLGIAIMGLGVAIFKLTLMGNDPANGLAIAVSDFFGTNFNITIIVINCLWFIVQLIFARKYIGVGTFFNWVFVGVFTTFFLNLLTKFFTFPEAFLPRLGIMAIGILILSLSVALYQTADLGISPYDSVSITMADRTPIPYFWCRIMTDSFCTLMMFLLGGIVGIGTLVCMLGLGPFVTFFTKLVAEPLCGIKPEKKA